MSALSLWRSLSNASLLVLSCVRYGCDDEDDGDADNDDSSGDGDGDDGDDGESTLMLSSSPSLRSC